MKQIDTYISVSEAKNKLLDLVRNLPQNNEVLAITREGLPAAILLSPERYEGLLETIEILGDKSTMRSLYKSIKQAQKGKWIKDVFHKK